MKYEKTLLIFLTISHLVLLTIIAILVYWSMKMNELRLSQVIDQNRMLSASFHKVGKLNNTGTMQVLGGIEIK